MFHPPLVTYTSEFCWQGWHMLKSFIYKHGSCAKKEHVWIYPSRQPFGRMPPLFKDETSPLVFNCGVTNAQRDILLSQTSWWSKVLYKGWPCKKSIKFTLKKKLLPPQQRHHKTFQSSTGNSFFCQHHITCENSRDSHSELFASWKSVA